MFLTHFRINDPAPFPLNTSEDRSFRCFQGAQDLKGSKLKTSF